ncbi:MAG TPA: hypothetical protein VMI11_06825 [Actinomycetes bacterium]|nr:hypothetical protein [Actinomycetes bacterium]
MIPSPLFRVLIVGLGLGSVVTLLTLAAIDPDGSTWALVWVAYAVMAVWVLWRLPGNRIGWFMLAIALIFTGVTLINWFVTGPGASGSVWIEVMSPVLGSAGWLTFLLMVALFPDGTAGSRAQRWLVGAGWTFMVMGALVTVTSSSRLPDTGRLGPLAGTALADLSDAAAPVGGVLVAVFPLLVLISLVVRWRTSDGVHRQQFKWFFWGAAITIVVLAIGSRGTDPGVPSAVAYVVWVTGGAALPLSIAIAVQRYRLYDVDRVISRTTSYAVVTGVLAALFAGVVALGSTALGSDNQLAVAAATLIAAALARPLYRRVQQLVDRRFDRARYDAVRTVDSFGARLRREVDPQVVSHDLLGVVDQALSPSMVGLWLRAPR